MQVWDGLTGVGAVVEDEAIPTSRKAKFLRDCCGLEQQVTERGVIFGLRLGDSRDGFLGNEQDMGRRLRIDIA